MAAATPARAGIGPDDRLNEDALATPPPAQRLAGARRGSTTPG